MGHARFILFILLSSISSAAAAQQSKPPALPYFDWNACPFEGCVYRKWTVKQPVVVYSTWGHARKAVGQLAGGDIVLAVTGVVITYKPGMIRINQDLPDYGGLKRGDIIYTYAYQGEDAWAVWLNGKYRDGFGFPPAYPADDPRCHQDCAATVLQSGNKEWWAKLKLPSGKTAWVNMDKEFAKFDGIDSLG